MRTTTLVALVALAVLAAPAAATAGEAAKAHYTPLLWYGGRLTLDKREQVAVLRLLKQKQATKILAPGQSPEASLRGAFKVRANPPRRDASTKAFYLVQFPKAGNPLNAAAGCWLKHSAKGVTAWHLRSRR